MITDVPFAMITNSTFLRVTDGDTLAMITDDTFAKPQYNAVRGLQTIGVAGGVLLVLFLIVYRMGYGKWTQLGQLNLAAFITCVLTCESCILSHSNELYCVTVR